MNINAIIAVLVLRNVITEAEGEDLVSYINDKPQSTVLSDAIAAVAEVIGKPQPKIMPQLGPVGPAQFAEETAARSTPAPTPAPAEVPNEPDNTLGTEPSPAASDVQQAPEATDEEKAQAEAAKKAEKEGGATYTPESDKKTPETADKK